MLLDCFDRIKRSLAVLSTCCWVKLPLQQIDKLKFLLRFGELRQNFIYLLVLTALSRVYTCFK